MVEYSWEILSLYTVPSENGLDKVVKKVNWRYQASEGTHVADVYGVTELGAPNPDGYVEYDNLSDLTVIGWLAVNTDLNAIKADVERKLFLVKNPPIVELSPPWKANDVLTGEEEYIVVFNNDATDPANLWGPLRWSSERVNAGLEAKGVVERVPEDILMYRKNLLPKDSPMVVNETTKIYRVTNEPTPDFDEDFQTRSNRTWVVDSGIAVGTWFVADKSVSEVKAALKEKVSSQSVRLQLRGFDHEIKGQTVSVKTDPYYRTTLLEKYLTLGDEGTLWRVGDQWFEFSKQDFLDLISAIDGFLHTFYAWEKDRFDEINAASTIEELRAVDVIGE